MLKSAKLTPYEKHKMKRTTQFGYALFLILVLSAVLSPLRIYMSFQRADGRPDVLPSLMLYVGLSSLVAIIAPLAAYYIGKHTTKARSAYEHHYNGILFALLATWISLLIQWISLPFAAQNIYLLIPPLVALVSVLTIAWVYAKRHTRILLHNFIPYQASLLGAITVLTVWSICTTFRGFTANDWSPVVIAAMSAALFVLIIWTGSRISRETTVVAKVTESAVAFSFGIWTYGFVELCLLSLGDVRNFASAVPLAVAFLTWSTYEYLLRFSAPIVVHK